MRRDEREEAVNRYVIAVAIATVPIIVVALALALRGRGDHSSTLETVPTAPVVEGTSSAATTSTTTAEAPCDPRLFLAVVRQGLTPADERRIARAKVVACRSDYARVNAVPDTSSCPPHCYQGGVMYLHWTGAEWRILDFGTGIDCEDITTLPPLPGPVRRACLALGYPQPTILRTLNFRTPSGNIGCVLGGTDLRCDILSGLKPEPTEACELDWVGLVLVADGPPKPNCAGDTAFSQEAPTLAYGDDWHRGAFWCRSDRSGLGCLNREGNSFQLAREGWEGG